jgi:GxxExxY protein
MKSGNGPYSEEGYKLMGAAFEVYNEQGYGMAEEIYHESLEIELTTRAIPFRPKQALLTYYKGHILTKQYIPDLFVFDAIVVELKAVAQILPEHESQLFNYMRISQSPVGYLINFGHKDQLEWKRFILTFDKKPASVNDCCQSTNK